VTHILMCIFDRFVVLIERSRNSSLFLVLSFLQEAQPSLDYLCFKNNLLRFHLPHEQDNRISSYIDWTRTNLPLQVSILNPTPKTYKKHQTHEEKSKL